MPRDYRGCKGHAGTRHMDRGTHNVQPPPGLGAHPEYQQGAPSVKSMVLVVPPEQVGYQRRWASEAYSEWDEGEEDQAKFDYGR